MKYTDNELINDYDNANGSISEKKELMVKYAVSSKRTADIQKSILIEMRNNRNKKTEFNENDVIWFVRLSDLPSRYTKLCEWLDNESSEFIKYLLISYGDRLKTKISHNGKSLFDIRSYATHKNWNYFMTSSERYMCNIYFNIDKYINEHDPDEVAKQKKQNDLVNIINEKLLEQTKDFKIRFMNQIKTWSTAYYTSLPEKINKLIKVIEDKEIYWENKKKEEKIERYNYNFYIRKDADMNPVKRELNEYEMIIKKFTLESFVEKKLNDGEIHFITNILALANKINEKKLNVSNIEVKHIDNDPKYFELLITDGETNLYARSIIAAEYSEVMRAHLRFIITNKK